MTFHFSLEKSFTSYYDTDTAHEWTFLDTYWSTVHADNLFIKAFNVLKAFHNLIGKYILGILTSRPAEEGPWYPHKDYSICHHPTLLSTSAIALFNRIRAFTLKGDFTKLFAIIQFQHQSAETTFS